MDSSSSAIKIENVWKVFGNTSKDALDAIQNQGISKTEALEEYNSVIGVSDVSFDVKQGEIFCVMGLSGSGKSTLVRHINRLLEPTSGQIIWRGSEGRNPSRFQAMVFQRPVMLRRSVRANIDFALSLRKFPSGVRRKRIDEVLSRCGLGQFSKTPARVLSFGEQQRLAMARSWALEPQVLFLDEPTANLDPSATHAIEELIRGMSRDGRKVIMCTHDLDQARRLAEEIIFLHRGRMLEKSSANQFLQAPKTSFAKAFLKGELLWWDRRELTPP